MTPAEQALARELARHPAWRWRDGMMSNAGRVWTEAYHPGGGTRDVTPRLPSGGKVSSGHYPDLADSATQGCLIAMLGDRLCEILFLPNTSSLCLGPDMSWTVVTVGNGGLACPTLGEALARAWLAVNGGAE